MYWKAKKMAEREGFEPSVPLLAVHTISNRAPSANSDISPQLRKKQYKSAEKLKLMTERLGTWKEIMLPRLRRILVRLQGTSAGAYQDMSRWM